MREQKIGKIDDIDHLGNRRVRSVGELLQNQVRLGLSRLERIIRERMIVCDVESLSLANLINPKPVIAVIIVQTKGEISNLPTGCINYGIICDVLKDYWVCISGLHNRLS